VKNCIRNDLQNEKKEVSNKLEQAKSVEEKDWSAAYTEIDEAEKNGRPINQTLPKPGAEVNYEPVI
jgi:hypothetical protein